MLVIGLLSSTYTHLLGTFAMTNWVLVLKKGLSTVLHHTSFFTKTFECSPESTNNVNGFFFCKGVLSFQTLSLGVMTPHITPVLYRLYNPAVLSFGEVLQGAPSSLVLSMRSDDLTYNPSPSNS